jgi:large subunit ribosomal protein L13e
MILFPVRTDKPKKGEIADSSAEQLKNASQNTQLGGMALKTVSKRCKPEELTQAMKDAKVYQKLRHERINKRYAGKREKAAKKAAEETAK